MSLSTFQDTFWRDLWGDHAVPAAMAVYRNTVIKGCVDALLSLYPAVHRLTGDAWMQAVALDYVRRHPPASGALQHYGEGFPAALAAALQHSDELPWLHEVALLDQCWQHSHGAADAPVLDLADLARLDAAALVQARLPLHPATRWHRATQRSVVSLWQAARQGAADPNPPAWQPESALVTRPTGAVQVIDIGAVEVAVLQACADGLALGQALEAAHGADPTDPALDAGAALARLVTQGAFTSLEHLSS